MLKTSNRSGFIEKAEIRTMSVECEKAKGINLAQGVCDTGVPEVVKSAVTEAMQKGVNSYTRHDGLAVLREAIAAKLMRENGVAVDAETEVVVSAGSTGAFYCACYALLDPGDEIILFEPFYGYHLHSMEAVGVKPRFVKLNPPDWSFCKRELEAAITPRTKGIMLCTPANPCGKVFTRAELDSLADFAIKHDLFVFTDEIYEYITYDGAKHLSPGSLAKIKDRTITIGGYSKTYSITGWRIGYAACRKEFAEAIGYLNDLVYVCAPAPLQYGVAKGINELESDFYDSLRSQYAHKRDLVCGTLDKAGLKPWVPQGAYYVLADATRLPGGTAKDKAMWLLKQTGVASVPGTAFYNGDGGDNILRFCYAKDESVLQDACRRLGALKL